MSSANVGGFDGGASTGGEWLRRADELDTRLPYVTTVPGRTQSATIVAVASPPSAPRRFDSTVDDIARAAKELIGTSARRCLEDWLRIASIFTSTASTSLRRR